MDPLYQFVLEALGTNAPTTIIVDKLRRSGCPTLYNLSLIMNEHELLQKGLKQGEARRLMEAINRARSRSHQDTYRINDQKPSLNTKRPKFFSGLMNGIKSLCGNCRRRASNNEHSFDDSDEEEEKDVYEAEDEEMPRIRRGPMVNASRRKEPQQVTRPESQRYSHHQTYFQSVDQSRPDEKYLPPPINQSQYAPQVYNQSDQTRSNGGYLHLHTSFQGTNQQTRPDGRSMPTQRYFGNQDESHLKNLTQSVPAREPEQRKAVAVVVPVPVPVPEPKLKRNPIYKVSGKKGSLEIRKLTCEEKRTKANFNAKTIILIGETGSGKTTLINAMSNYLLNVKFRDPFRYQVIIEQTGKSQSQSQTTKVTCYGILDYFHGFQVRFIDTPGFADTDGIEKDQENKKKIHELLKSEERIDAVCFICKASQNRFTAVQTYVMEEVLTLFGKDAEKNIFLMLTFADAGEPLVVKALKAKGFPFNKHYQFNNSALLEDPANNNKLTELFWQIGETSMKEFFSDIKLCSPFSLILTKEVITEREKLATIMSGLMPQISNGLAQLANKEDIKRQIALKTAEINETQCFTYTHRVTKSRRVPCAPGSATTYCPTCHFTCHSSCRWFNRDDKVKCSAMDVYENCLVCPKRCKALIHHHDPSIIEYYTEVEEREAKEIKDQHNKSKSDLTFAEQLQQDIQAGIEDAKRACFESLEFARNCANKLGEIALKKENMSMQDYIELQIESEKKEMKADYKARVDSLEKLKKEAEIMYQIMNNEQVSEIENLGR